jgi:hypothetical protein
LIDGERVGGILAAGGSGLRAGLAKQWLALGGESVLRRSTRLLASCPFVDEVVVVVPPGEEARGAAVRAGTAAATPPGNGRHPTSPGLQPQETSPPRGRWSVRRSLPVRLGSLERSVPGAEPGAGLRRC